MAGHRSARQCRCRHSAPRRPQPWPPERPWHTAATVHPRMPVVVPWGLDDDWLDPSLAGDGDLLAEALSASEELSWSMEIVGVLLQS